MSPVSLELFPVKAGKKPVKAERAEIQWQERDKKPVILLNPT